MGGIYFILRMYTHHLGVYGPFGAMVFDLLFNLRL